MLYGVIHRVATYLQFPTISEEMLVQYASKFDPLNIYNVDMIVLLEYVSISVLVYMLLEQ